MFVWLRAGAVVATGLVAQAMTVQPATANEICVRCQGPDTAYRCRAEPTGRYAGLAKNERLLNYACIKYIAEKYRHASCKAGGGEDQTCQGTKLTIDLSAVADQYAARLPEQLKPKAAPPTPPPGDDQAEGQPKKKEEPKTVVELAKRTAEASKREIEGAGKAVKDAGKYAGDAVKGAGEYVGDAAKKTWRCLSSLFQRC